MTEEPDAGGVVVGVDVGGTFTDLVVAGPGGVRIAKVPSVPSDQTEGIVAGLDQLGLPLTGVSRFVHGTTVATNTVLERDGARVVLLTTAGVPDLLTIGRQDRPRLYDLAARRPAPLVERDLVVEVLERVGADGTHVVELSDAEVARVAGVVEGKEPDAVAISLLFGFLEPSHEQRLEAALHHLDVPISRASRLLPVFREVERTSTVVLNAYVAPRMRRYLGSLERSMAERGLPVTVEVMRSGGGTSAASLAAEEPAHTLLSGPAAGAWGAAAVGRALGVADLIAFDVGGTSTDVTLVEAGRPGTSADATIDGLALAVTSTDIHTIGAGGGSIAWHDAGGALRVGPRSAGAHPGPACYGRGGDAPTLTDADLVLGRLDPDVRLGGSVTLDRGAAHAAVERLARSLAIDPGACADGIVRVAEAHMIAALRVVSVERGRDPRRFSLVPFGGAGPLHQAALAAALGTPRVLVPPHPGVLSALGLLAAPPTVDRARSVVRPLEQVEGASLRRAWERLTDEATGQLRRQDTAVGRLRTSADLRYRGQGFELEVDVGDHREPSVLGDAFHAAHLERHGYAQRDEPIELVTLRVRAEGPPPDLPLPPWTGGGSAGDAVLVERRLPIDGTMRDTPVLDRAALAAGCVVRGPAVLLGTDATVWLAPWQRATVEEHGALLLEDAGTP